MKIIVLGDIHGNPIWKDIVAKESDYDIVIFLGDYLDSHTFSRDEQLKNLIEIIEFAKSSDKETILLVGNHDFHYFSEINHSTTSGYSKLFKYQVSPILDENRELFKICHKIDKFLFSHAGISPEFMDEKFGNEWNLDNIDEKLNELFHYQPLKFEFDGFDPYGDNTWQTPIWIRPYSLMKSNKDKLIHQNLIQIVGHTMVTKIDIEGKATGGKYFFIDSLDNKEYLVINDGIITSKKL